MRALAELDRTGRVTLDIDERLPDVLADPGLLERVVANVVDNALRYAGGALIALRASAHNSGWSCASSTRDRACPARAGEPLLALPAAGADPSDRDGRDGVGLGLAVARGFTEVMGGTLTAEDTPGGGLDRRRWLCPPRATAAEVRWS